MGLLRSVGVWKKKKASRAEWVVLSRYELSPTMNQFTPLT